MTAVVLSLIDQQIDVVHDALRQYANNTEDRTNMEIAEEVRLTLLKRKREAKPRR